jgi:hypothetical protein
MGQRSEQILKVVINLKVNNKPFVQIHFYFRIANIHANSDNHMNKHFTQDKIKNRKHTPLYAAAVQQIDKQNKLTNSFETNFERQKRSPTLPLCQEVDL